eukprot:3757117-Amphidinium_carterae.1
MDLAIREELLEAQGPHGNHLGTLKRRAQVMRGKGRDSQARLPHTTNTIADEASFALAAPTANVTPTGVSRRNNVDFEASLTSRGEQVACLCVGNIRTHAFVLKQL